jgi:hypothetical protein
MTNPQPQRGRAIEIEVWQADHLGWHARVTHGVTALGLLWAFTRRGVTRKAQRQVTRIRRSEARRAASQTITDPRKGLVSMDVDPPQGSTATGPPVDYDG